MHNVTPDILVPYLAKRVKNYPVKGDDSTKQLEILQEIYRISSSLFEPSRNEALQPNFLACLQSFENAADTIVSLYSQNKSP